MKENKFFGIFNDKEYFVLNRFFAFKGKIDRFSFKPITDEIMEYTGTMLDELGKSHLKIMENKDKEIMLVDKIYTKKFDPRASKDILLYAYKREGELFCGQYSLMQRGNKLSRTLGYFSVLAFGNNFDIIMDRLSQIEDFYKKNNQIPPTKKELETSFQKIDLLKDMLK